MEPSLSYNRSVVCVGYHDTSLNPLTRAHQKSLDDEWPQPINASHAAFLASITGWAIKWARLRGARSGLCALELEQESKPKLKQLKQFSCGNVDENNEQNACMMRHRNLSATRMQWAGFHVFARAETITASTRRPCSIQLSCVLIGEI